MQKTDFLIQILQTCPNASERIQMHPNASECIQAHPNRSKQFRKPRKTWENVEQLREIVEILCEPCETISVTSRIFFRLKTGPNGSKWVRMGPNGSEWVWTRSKTSKISRDRPKFTKFRVISRNFVKISRKRRKFFRESCEIIFVTSI